METYIPDAPLKDPKGDLFRRWPFAQRVAHTIANRFDPSSIVIGVYGNWGEGKTTVLNFIEAELLKDNSIVCVRFNPWLFSTQHQLILSFFDTLAKALDKSLHTRTEKIGKFLSEYGNLVVPISVSPIPLIDISPGETLKGVGKRLASPELDVLKKRIESILKGEQKRVVVLMDDIDRLDKEEIYSIFKLVKLTADFEYTAYILAFDFEMVANALRERYSGADSDAGTSFLEKIIQVPLMLPKADQQTLRQLCFQGADQALQSSGIPVRDAQGQEFARHFVDGLEIRLNTPRMAKRYTNALAFALPILKGEVNPVDLMLVEGIRVFYPRAYDFIRKHPEMFYGVFNPGVNNEREKGKLKESIETMLGTYPTDDAAAIRGLLQTLFPKLKAVFGNNYYGSEWQVTWGKEQRVCSKDYFARYFAYTVPEGDVPDSIIDSFLEDVHNLPYKKSAATLSEMITARNAERVVMKLRRRENELSEADSEILGRTIAGSGSLFPHSKEIFSFGGASTQAAILVSQLMRNIPKGSRRVDSAKQIVKIAEPLPFAAEISRWFRSSKKENETERLFAEDEEDAISKSVAKRIRSKATKTILYTTYPDDSPFLFWMWSNWLGRAEVAKYLEDTFKKSNRNVLKFLMTYLPTTLGMESGLPGIGDIERDQYDSVAKLVDTEVVLRKLGEIYGDDIKNAASIYPYRNEAVDKKVAYQFAAMHHLVAKANQQKADDIKKEQGAPPDQGLTSAAKT